MLNFTVGPVMMNERVLNVAKQQIPYFRTEDFSCVMKENERLMKEFALAEENARVVFITGSGTASMEASVMNTLTTSDKVLIINGGSFGQRFVDICTVHNIPYTEIKLESGKALKREKLYQYNNCGYTALLVNAHETSTGVLYDMNMISKFSRENNLFLIVDAISSFLADKLDMKGLNIDILITGSQKALACPPGISIIVLSGRAIKKVESNKVNSLYFDLKLALENGERGQTPFTPAVGILLQINERLKGIAECGGLEAEHKKIKMIAEDFRSRIKGLPFEIVSESMSYAVTPLHPLNVPAYKIFQLLKKEYNIWVCPNGGDLRDYLIRIGHIGALSVNDNTILINAFKDMEKRGLI